MLANGQHSKAHEYEALCKKINENFFAFLSKFREFLIKECESGVKAQNIEKLYSGILVIDDYKQWMPVLEDQAGGKVTAILTQLEQLMCTKLNELPEDDRTTLHVKFTEIIDKFKELDIENLSDVFTVSQMKNINAQMATSSKMDIEENADQFKVKKIASGKDVKNFANLLTNNNINI